MKAMWNKLVIVTFTIILVGCGIKLNPIGQAFIPPPPSLKERSLWPDPSVLQYKLDSLVGYIIHKSPENSDYVRVRQILTDGYTLTLEPIKEGLFYHSVINSTFATQGEGNIPILSVAASLTSEQAMELSINDKAIVHIKEDAIPWNKLKAFKTANPLKAGDQRYWVQATMLTQLSYKLATKIDSDATVSGSAYKVASQNYNAAETFTRTPYITMLTLDFDAAIDSGAGLNNKSLTDSAISPVILKGGLTEGPLKTVKGIEVWYDNFPVKSYDIIQSHISPPYISQSNVRGNQRQFNRDEISNYSRPKVIEYAVEQAIIHGADSIVIHRDESYVQSCPQQDQNCRSQPLKRITFNASLIKSR